MVVDPRKSLRTKLVAIIAIQNIAVAVFMIVYFPLKMDSLSRSWMEGQGKSLALVLSKAVAPGIEFNDEQYVADILSGLAAAPDVTYAAVRRRDGSILGAWNPRRVRDVGLRATDRPVTAERGGQLHVAARVTGGSGSRGSLDIGISLRRVQEQRQSNYLIVGAISLIVLLGGLIVAVVVGTYLVRPIQQMTEIAREVATGDLTRATGIAAGPDEVGQMAAAFDQMVGSQKKMVQEITATSTQLASAATQIYAAAQEQEAAAAEQQVAVEEVARTMQSLLEAAGHIADTARGVLTNAEQTRETTHQTAMRIAELSGHTNRIAEILEVIRDIADRSDLLALNASLEATRAGEAGRSFALVAAEMRRLAERVTASVSDVKALVADVRASGSSTVLTTEHSRKLADGTTESARQITMVTQQQRTGTEQVSQSMRQFSEVLTQSVQATQQTRSSAEQLKELADRLSELVGRFRVS